MLQKFLIITCLLICFGCKQDKKKSIVKTDNSISQIIATNPTNWIITAEGLGFIKLGNSVTPILNELKKIYKIEKTTYKTYRVYEKKEKIIDIYIEVNTNLIDEIVIYTDKWKTERGLKIGLKIGEIESFYSDFFLEYDTSGFSEYFYTCSNFKRNNKVYKSCSKFYFSSGGLDFLGEYDLLDTKRTKYKSYNNNEKGILNFLTLELVD